MVVAFPLGDTRVESSVEDEEDDTESPCSNAASQGIQFLSSSKDFPG